MTAQFKATHYGSMFGVPVLLNMENPDAPEVKVKFVILEPVLDLMEFLFSCFTWVQTFVNSDYEPSFPILIKGEVRR